MDTAVGEGAQACLSPDSGYVHSQEREEEDRLEDTSRPVHTGATGLCPLLPPPLSTQKPQPADLGGPWCTVDCARASTHMGGHGWARLPRMAPNPGSWPLGGRRDGKAADDHGSGVPSTLHTPLGVRNSSRSKKGRRQPLGSRDAASGPEVGARVPRGVSSHQLASGMTADGFRLTEGVGVFQAQEAVAFSSCCV